MRILLTRPREDSDGLAARLEAMGHQVTIEPLFAIRPDLEAPLDLAGVQALLFTSANGVRAFALRAQARDLPVFAVGDATAAAAREFGFARVESAGGNVADLARLVRERLQPQDGALLHAAGSAVAGDLGGELAAAGFEVRRAVLYHAEPVESLSQETAAALAEGRIDLVAFFSPRTAATFASLARDAGLEGACAGIAMVGLSPAVMAAAELPWRARETADAPTEASLIEAIARLDSRSGQGDPAREMMSEPPPTSPPEEKADATRARRDWAVPVGVAIVLALAALGWSGWRELSRPPDAGAALAQAQQRIETLARDTTARLGALERDLGGRLAAADQARAALGRSIEAVGTRLGAVESQLGALSARLEAAAAQLEQLEQEPRGADPARLAALTTENRRLAQELARLQEEVAAMNGAMGERADTRREALTLALASLRDAVARGAPFAAELTSVRALAGEDLAFLETLAPLGPYAARGIPPRNALRARFDRVAADIVRAAHVSDDRWGRVIDRLMAAISVRPVGEVEGDSPAAVVARVERRLGADDLAGAVAELGKLSGAAAEPARAWLADARARLAAEAAVARATAQALRLGAGSESRAGP